MSNGNDLDSRLTDFHHRLDVAMARMQSLAQEHVNIARRGDLDSLATANRLSEISAELQDLQAQLVGFEREGLALRREWDESR